MSHSCINNGEVTIQAEIAEEVTAKQTKRINGMLPCDNPRVSACIEAALDDYV